MPGEMPRWRRALTAVVGAEAPWKPGLLRAERSAEAAAGASRVDLRRGQLDEKAFFHRSLAGPHSGSNKTDALLHLHPQTSPPPLAPKSQDSSASQPASQTDMHHLQDISVAGPSLKRAALLTVSGPTIWMFFFLFPLPACCSTFHSAGRGLKGRRRSSHLISSHLILPPSRLSTICLLHTTDDLPSVNVILSPSEIESYPVPGHVV